MAEGMGAFLGQYNKESGLIREENDKKNAADAAIEQRALEHLANSDHPDIRAAAVTAMLTPKKMGAAGPLSQWFGKQQSHPVFSDVHRLINGGAQPFMGVEERSAATTAGTVSGRIEGANTGYRNITGEDLPNEALARGAQGALGAPPNRRAMPQYGTITLADGTTVAGSFDPETQEYADSDGNYVSGAKSFSRTNGAAGGGNPSTGGQWITQPDGRGGFTRVHVDAHGKPMSEGVPTVGPNAPPNQIFQTPGGFTGVAPGRDGGAPPKVIDVQGGSMPTKPESPGVSFDALRKIADDVEKRAQGSVAHFGGLPPDAKELQIARDREAQTAGFENHKALMAQIAAGQRAIGAATQGAGTGAPPAGIEAAPPASGGPAARPGAKGPTKPAETKPGQRPAGKPRAAVPGKLDVNSIMAELDKLQREDNF